MTNKMTNKTETGMILERWTNYTVYSIGHKLSTDLFSTGDNLVSHCRSGISKLFSRNPQPFYRITGMESWNIADCSNIRCKQTCP